MKNKANVFLLLGVALAVVLGCRAPQADTRTAPASTAPQVKLLSASCERSSNYLTLSGEVQNISNEKIEALWVVVSHYDKDGRLITSDESVIAYTPLMPGQISPFTAMTPDNPLIESYNIGFITTFGGQVSHIDARPAATPKGKKKK